MAQYEAILPDIEVNGQTVLSFVNSMELGMESRLETLQKHGIDPKPQQWYPQQAWLNAFRELGNMLGEMNLFMIGKAIISNADFPPMEGLEHALRSIDVAYHMNHRRNGQVMFNPENGTMLEGIGHYSLTEFNAESRQAKMVCDNPYPSKFDEGIIIQVLRNFKPENSISQSVQLDTTQETRKNGGNSCTYLITW